jgi:hypothetical protein
VYSRKNDLSPATRLLMSYVPSRTIALALIYSAFGAPHCFAFLAPAPAPNVQWIAQFGTDTPDWTTGVASDGLGHVFTSGYTAGSLGGPSAGFFDAFLSKYSDAGSLIWARQLGTAAGDYSQGVSGDRFGNAFVAGYTVGGSLGGPSFGMYDAFIAKYDGAGNRLWTRQLGTAQNDGVHAVSADSLGNVYISGWSGGNLGGPNAGNIDAMIAKYDGDGNLLWTRQLGSASEDTSYGVSANGFGSVFITGSASGDLAQPNGQGRGPFVSKYDSSGSLLWTRQLGGIDRGGVANAVSSDGLGNVYIVGTTDTSLGGPWAGANDAFVAKYDGDGNLVWTRQLGTPSYDDGLGISADALGNVFVSGDTAGSLAAPNTGFPNSSTAFDAFVSKFDAAGTLLWTKQIGTAYQENGYGISADGLGNAYFGGVTGGSLGGAYIGDIDSYLAKISEIPEPPSLGSALTAIALTVLCGCNCVRRRA